MNTFIALAPLFSLFVAQTPLADATVVLGKPSVKVESAEESTTRSELSDAQREEFRLLIVRRDNRYYWVSRENRELVHRASGAFHYFIDPTGGGYVKVFDTHALPESLRPTGPRFQYMEHVTLWLGTITYWGTVDKFSE